MDLPPTGQAHNGVTESAVDQALDSQLVKKATEFHQLLFEAVHLR